MSVEFRSIRTDEFEECLDLWSAAFEGASREYFVPYFHGDPWFKPDYSRVCSVDGKLVSAVQVCRRPVRIGDSEIIMGGIGNVATLPEHRGKGYSTRLLKDSIDVMYENDIDFSVLFTGIQPFYERLGWKSVPIRFTTGQLRSDIDAHLPPGYSIRELDRRLDLDSVQHIYDDFNARRTYSMVRNPDYWTGYVLSKFDESNVVLVIEAQGDVVGYMVSENETENCWFNEIGYYPGHEVCAEALVRNTAVRCFKAGARIFWNYLPHDPAISRAIDRVAERHETRESGGTMAMVINMESLRRRILPELNRRAEINNPPNGVVILETEIGRLSLSVNERRVSLDGNDAIPIPISQADFFSLLLGIKGIDELDVSVPDDAGLILSALFPLEQPVYWRADHF